MTGSHPVEGEHVPWEGSSPAVDELRGILVVLAPEGALRIILQRLALTEDGRPVGEHRIIDAVTDVEGNLVSVPLTGRVQADPVLARAVDEAVDRLQRDIVAGGIRDPSGIELVLDADGTRQVRVAVGLVITPGEIEADAAHPALRDGGHHITHAAPLLDELRDRVAGPPPGPVRRLWGWLTRAGGA